MTEIQLWYVGCINMLHYFLDLDWWCTVYVGFCPIYGHFCPISRDKIDESFLGFFNLTLVLLDIYSTTGCPCYLINCFKLEKSCLKIHFHFLQFSKKAEKAIFWSKIQKSTLEKWMKQLRNVYEQNERIVYEKKCILLQKIAFSTFFENC